MKAGNTSSVDRRQTDSDPVAAYEAMIARLHQIVRDSADEIATGQNYYDNNPDLIDLLSRLGMPVRQEPHLDRHAVTEEMVEVVAGVLGSVLRKNRTDHLIPWFVMSNLERMLMKVQQDIGCEQMRARGLL